MAATATLDRFGRILIPKAVRDDLGLEPGAVLHVQEQDDGIVLKPVDQSVPIQLKKGVLVFTGAATGDITDVLARHRDERLRGLTGTDRT